MIKIVGAVDPFKISLTSETEPFSIDQYFEIHDEKNSNPVCRVISTTSQTENNKVIHYAVAKMETSIVSPVNPEATISVPTFAKMKKYIMNTEPTDGFLMGEVLGTTYADIPDKYRNLMLMKDNDVLRPQSKVPFIFNYKKLYESPHVGFFGGSGSGKTVALKVCMEEAMKKNIPVLLMDPHLEMNFSGCKSEIPDDFKQSFAGKFEMFSIGENVGIDFCDLTSDELTGIMSFSGELSGAMNSLVHTLHQRGETFLALNHKIETLISAMEKRDLKQELNNEEALNLAIYGSKIPSPATLQALSWRLATLNSASMFNKDSQLLESAMIHQKICVVRGAMTQLNILAGYVIEKFYNLRRAYIDGKELHNDAQQFPPFLVAMDEAHLFCPNYENYTPSKRILRTISQEGRKYGVFEILATQRPSLLDSTVVAQMATKLIFRISIKEDLLSVGRETDLTEDEIKRLPYMNSGECYVSSSITGKTMSVKIRYNITEAKMSINPFDEIEKLSDLSDVDELLLSLLPITPLNSMDVVAAVIKFTGKAYSIPQLNSDLSILKDKGKVYIDKGMLGTSYLIVS